MLDDLYLGLSMVMEGESVADRAAELRQVVQVGFVGDEGEKGLLDFVARLPDRYVLANDADAVRRHARMVRDGGQFALGLGPGPSDGVSELVLWTEDRPGLLADMCAVLASRHVGVVGAQVYTVDGMAFDILWVRRAQEGRPSMEGEASRLDQKLRALIERDLVALLQGEISADVILERIPAAPIWAVRHSPRVPTVVNVDNGVSPKHTVVDVFARDRVGVLHAIARTLHEQGVSIRLAKVNTEGERVADVFYVCTAEGEKLDSEAAKALEQALLAALPTVTEDSTPP